MLFINDDTASALVTHELAFKSVAAAFRDLTAGVASINPVVIGTGCRAGESYSVKSGVSNARDIVGLKVGSYWPVNTERGLPAHSSNILLLSPATGRPFALVSASRLNGYRTAAADAVAVHALARQDSAILAVIGAGHQARFEVEALRRVRPIRKVLIVSRRSEVARAWAGELTQQGLEACHTDVESACRAADVLITATSSRAPLFQADWVRPGTHISSIGSDQAGKQELPTELLAVGKLFADLPSQSVVIGECQHAAALINAGKQELIAIGAVLNGSHPGRGNKEEITIFDSSGLALQDLYVASEIVDRAVATGKAIEVEGL